MSKKINKREEDTRTFEEKLHDVRETLPEYPQTKVVSLRKLQKEKKLEKLGGMKKVDYKENESGFYDMNVTFKETPTSEKTTVIQSGVKDLSIDDLINITKESPEVWKDIPGWKGYYQMSNKGNVRSVDRYNSANRYIKGKVLKLHKTNFTYKLSKDGNIESFNIFNLLGRTFLGGNDNTTYTFIHNQDYFGEEDKEQYFWLTNCCENKISFIINETDKKGKENVTELRSFSELIAYLKEKKILHNTVSRKDFFESLNKFGYDEEADCMVVEDYIESGIIIYVTRGVFFTMFKEVIDKEKDIDTIVSQGKILDDEYIGIRLSGKEISEGLKAIKRIEDQSSRKFRMAHALYCKYIRDNENPLNMETKYTVRKDDKGVLTIGNETLKEKVQESSKKEEKVKEEVSTPEVTTETEETQEDVTKEETTETISEEVHEEQTESSEESSDPVKEVIERGKKKKIYYFKAKNRNLYLASYCIKVNKENQMEYTDFKYTTDFRKALLFTPKDCAEFKQIAYDNDMVNYYFMIV